MPLNLDWNSIVTNTGWPNELRNDELVTGIRHNKYKWKYTISKYPEEHVLKKFKREK